MFLKVNGKNEGVYLELESVDEFYLAKRKLADGAVFTRLMMMLISL